MTISTAERSAPIRRREEIQAASDDYLAGKISVEEYEAIEEQNTQYVRKAIADLARYHASLRPKPRKRDSLFKLLRSGSA